MSFHNSVTKPLGSLHVAELARESGVTPATVRYYARVGLLNPDREPENGYRCFSGRDRTRVLFIRRAQALGLTIGDIKSVLKIADDGEVPCHQVKSLVEKRLSSIRKTVAELQATEALMTEALAAWDEVNDPSPVDGELCPLIERLSEETDGLLSIERAYENGGKPADGLRRFRTGSAT